MLFEIQCLKYDSELTVIPPDGSVDEVNLFTICIKSDTKLANPILLLTDIPIRLTLLCIRNKNYWYVLDEHSIKEYFKTQEFDHVFDIYKQSFFIREVKENICFYKLFINYPIGKCTIVLFDDQSENILCETKINISSYKIDSQEFSSLISYVEKRGSSIWAKYSLIKHEAEGFDAQDHLDWLLVYVEDLIAIFTEKYLLTFLHDKITVLIPKETVESYDSETSISENSILWLFENLDVLYPTVSHDLDKVMVNRRPFSPNEILASNLFESTDCIENQVIHGFFHELNNFLQGLLLQIEIQIQRATRNTFEEYIEVYAFRIKIKRLTLILTQIRNTISILTEHIPVTRYSIDFGHLNKIEAKEHYYYVYLKFLGWLNNKSATFAINNKYFKGISRLDQLFEKACFYNLLDALTTIGYKLGTEVLADGKIPLVKDSITHHLYYQSIPDELTTIKKDSSSLKPDFILDLGNKGYIVMDAKYKKNKNISKYDYPDLVLKYLHGIGPKSGGIFNAKSLLVFYPDKVNRVDFYHKSTYTLGGKHTIFPVIGSIGFNFDEENTKLVDTLSDILESI